MNKFFIVQCLPETVRFMGSLIFLLVMQSSVLKKPIKFKNVWKKENSWVTLMRKKSISHDAIRPSYSITSGTLRMSQW